MPAKGTGWSYSKDKRAYCRVCNKHPYVRPLETCPEGHKKAYQKSSELSRQQWLALKTRVLTKLGKGKCACSRCGFTDIRALSIEHTNGGGGKERKSRGGNVYLYHAIDSGERNTDDLDVFCMNCQFVSDYERRWFSIG